MKSFVYAYVIGTFHIKKKINVFNDKDLPRSRKIIFWILKWLQNFEMNNGAKWHNLKHYALK
jgi:hypothetical protein